MHCLFAKKLLADPSLIDQARNTLARWRKQTPDLVPFYFFFLGRERIVSGRPGAMAGFLTSTRKDARRPDSAPSHCVSQSDRPALVEEIG
jgi:hypothetical protein